MINVELDVHDRHVDLSNVKRVSELPLNACKILMRGLMVKSQAPARLSD